MDTLWQDVRYGVRSLARTRLFTITALLTLALGIGATTSMFTLIDGILLRPLPFADADRLTVLAARNATANLTAVSYPNFLDWQAQASPQTFTGLAFVRGRATTLNTDEGPKTLIVGLTSPGFFRILGQGAVLGRLYTEAEEREGAHVAVLTWSAWQQEFGGDRKVVGRSLPLSDGSFTVIGVLPQGIVYPNWAGIYFPVTAVAATEAALTARALRADSRTIARLAPGVTMARAQEELSVIAKRLATTYADANADWPGASVTRLRDEVLAGAPSQLRILTGAVLLVLLIGWVNVANLALVRATTRTRELAIRVAMGASRTRIVRQMLTEYLLLAAAAGLLGTLLATWTVALIVRVATGVLPRTESVGVNGRVLAFSAGVVLLSAIAVGLLPALRSGSAGLVDALKHGTTGAGAGRRQQRLRSALVVGEIALALTLVIGAGLLIRSFWQLTSTNPGFDSRQLMAIDIAPPGTRYERAEQAALFYGRALEAVRTLPGVQQAALTNHLPLNGAALSTRVDIAGRASDPANDPSVLFRTISPEYVDAMRIRLKRGRGFTTADLTSGNAVLVNESFAKAFWPGADPVGRAVTLHKSAQGRPDFGEPMPSLVVGVIGDVRHFGIASAPVPEIYIPYTRNPWTHMVVVARTVAEPNAIVPAMRRALLGVDPAIALTGGALGGFQAVDDIRTGGLSGQRLNMSLLGGFAASALLLSAIGIYGLMAFAVTQRRREIGIRIALGAQKAQVLHLMLGTGLRLIGLGVLLGAAGAYALTRLMTGLLFGVTPTDPATFIATSMLLASVAALACYIPARRAMRVDPVVSLRSE